MERKFKNADFRVAGNQFLLKSFLEEAKSRYGIPTYTDKTHEKNDVILEDSTFKGGATRPEKYRLYTLPQHYQQAMDEIAELEIKEVSFKEGEWYRYKDGSVARYQKSGYGYGWGKHHHIRTGKYECSDVIMTNSDYRNGAWRKATEEEIGEALLKIAAERGFTKGARFHPVNGSCLSIMRDVTRVVTENLVADKANRVEWRVDTTREDERGLIYFQGRWAEIVTAVTPDVTVGGKKGEFEANGVTFGCTFLSKDRIKSLYGFLDHWNKDITNTNTVIETLESVTGVQLHISTLKIMYDYYFKKDESTGN